jgi:4-amino-4-deoxy-L-arabinose transferase-like glycosyltransferase
MTRERLLVAGLLLVTVVVRGGVLWAMRGNLEQDPDAYREIAENILQHGVYGLGKDLTSPPPPTAYRPPLYPIVLSNLPTPDASRVALWKVAVLHVLLGMGTVWLTYLTAKRLSSLTLRVRQALPATPTLQPDSSPNQSLFQRLAPTECGPTLAAVLVACDPILLNQQTLVMTETLATFLAILSLWCLTRYSAHRYWWNAALAGGAIGLAALCRPTFLPWLMLVAVVMLISGFRFRISDLGKWASRALPNVAALVIAAAAVMSPWAIRNQQEFGKPMLTTTHGGYTLWLGNNVRFYDWLKNDTTGLPWDARQLDSERYTVMTREIELQPIVDLRAWHLRVDELDHEAAMKAIRGDSRSFIYSMFYRLGQLWSPLPHKLTMNESMGRRLLRYGTAAWYVGVYLLASVGVWRLRWRLFARPWVWGVLLCFAFTAVHTLYWCNLRMRAPLMPFVALVAAAALLPTLKRSP